MQSFLNVSLYGSENGLFNIFVAPYRRENRLLTFCETDINYRELWTQTSTGLILQILMATFSASVAALAGAKLLAYIQHGELVAFSVPQSVLILRIATSLYRTAYWATDPMFLNRYFTGATRQILLSICFPFDIVWYIDRCNILACM